MNRKMRNQKGITMIELMIVVVIIGLIAGMAVPRFKNAYERIQFRSISRDIVSTMRLARSLAITNKQNVGVAFNASAHTVTLFQKDTASTVLNLLESTDSVLTVDTLPKELGYLGTDLTNSTLVYRPNGSADFTGGGNIYTFASTTDMVGVYHINILASTGRVTSTGYYY